MKKIESCSRKTIRRIRRGQGGARAVGAAACVFAFATTLLVSGAARATGDAAPIGGVVMPVRQSKLSFTVPGRLVEVPTQGTLFEAGVVISRLDDATARTRRDKAKAALDAAKLGLVSAQSARAKVARLIREKILAEVAIEEADISVDKAHAAVAGAQSSFDEAQLVEASSALLAPFRGMVIDVEGCPQEWVSQGQTVLTFADLDKLELAIDVEPAVAATIGRDTQTEIFVGAVRVGRARIKRVMPFTDPASGLTRAVWSVTAEAKLLMGRYVTLAGWEQGS